MRRLIPGVATAMLLAACTETPSSFPPCVLSPCVEDGGADALVDGADDIDGANDGGANDGGASDGGANDGGANDGGAMADGPRAVGRSYRATHAPLSRRGGPLARVRGAPRTL